MAEYRGLIGAFRYAFRESGSWLFRTYVVACALVGAYVVILLGLAFVSWLGNPTGAIGEFSLLGVIAILLLVPMTAPVLVVAYRRRHGDTRPRVERALALAGYGFLASVYLGLVVADPSDHGTGAVMAAIDAVPSIYGLVPPVLGATLVGALSWFTR